MNLVTAAALATDSSEKRGTPPAVEDAIYTFDFHRESLIALIRALDIRRVTLVCQDWGGLLGLTIPMEMANRFEAGHEHHAAACGNAGGLSFCVHPRRFPGPCGGTEQVPGPRDRTLSAYFEFRFFDVCFNQQRKCWTDIRFIGGLLILYGYIFASGYAAQLQWLARLFTA